VTTRSGSGDKLDATGRIERCRRAPRRGRSLTSPANWLASRLNAIADARADYPTLGLAERTEASELIGRCVAAVDGDHREPDVIWLPDGFRVCWHLAIRRAETRWVVEGPGEPCRYGRVD